jgi:hypothetical protein
VCRNVLLLMVLLLVGCIPAQVPDMLDDTPGPPVVIDGDWYRGTVFQVRVPSGWRVITSEARVPQGVILVAPEDAALMRLTLESNPSLEGLPDSRTESTVISLGDTVQVTVLWSAAEVLWDTYEPQFIAARESLSLSQPRP